MQPRLANQVTSSHTNLHEIGVCVRVVAQNRVQSHHNSGRAKPTLRPMEVGDPLLDWVQALCMGVGARTHSHGTCDYCMHMYAHACAYWDLS